MKWPENVYDAREEQLRLAQQTIIEPLNKKIVYVAGADAAYIQGKVIGAACIYRYPDLVILEEAYAFRKLSFPYVPGYLTFREGPALFNAVKKLKRKPDLFLFDGQGIAHQHHMGLATHLGILLNTPSVGCAKSRLVGQYKEPGNSKGESTELLYKGRTVGAVLRTRTNIKPLFVSPGHLIDIRDSLDVVLACTGKFRIPEPLRYADRLSRMIKKRMIH